MTPKPSCESARLEALYHYEILDTLSDPAFDDLARLASYVCHTPIAEISFVDAERQWFKSVVGLDHKETQRKTAFCSHTILGTDFFIVENADTDERFKDYPWVIGPPALRFYTGVPLISPDGYAIGSLAVMDMIPRTLSSEQRACLRTIANQVMAQLELRRPPRLDSRQERDRRKESEDQLQKILERTAYHAGSAYFAALVQELATATGVNHAFCARVLPGGIRAQTIALWSGGAAQPNFDYDLAGTPCEQVSDGTLCHYPTGVQTLFPDSTLLQQMGIESYMGVPLLGSRGTPVGWISIMGAGTIQAPTRAEAILRLCGGRASSELERMEAEVARQKSQQLLENIVENIPLAVFVKDPEDEFRIRLWNQAAESIFGIPRTDMLGRNAHDLWPKQQADSDLTNDQRCIAEGVAQDILEEPGISQRRGDIALHTRKVPFFDEAGRATHLLSLCEDITDRKRTEEERSKQELLISLMLSTGPGCIKRVAADGTLLHMNPAGLAMIEACREEDAIGLSVFDLVLPEHRAAFMSMHQDVISGASRILQFEIQSLQGNRRWMETHAAPFRNPVTDSMEHLAVTHDITERKQAEEALKQSEERYRVLYDETPTMYFTLATDGTVRSVNRFGSTQLLYQAEELIGHSVLDIFHEEDREAVTASLSECLATPEMTRHWEFRKVRKDGSIIWVQETAHVSRSSSGETVVLVTCEDVTARKRTEQALTFFRTLLDYVDDSIEIIDPHTGQFLDGNKGAASNLGYTRDELLTLTVPDIDPLVTGPVFAGLMKQLKDTPDPMILDSLHRRKDGTTFPVEVSAQLIRLDKDYLVAIVRDSTERKQTEQALRLAKFSMDRAADAVYWVTARAEILDVNEAASLMLGYSKEELCAMTLHDLNPDFPADMWPGLWAETKRRRTMVMETVHRAKNGQLIPIEVSVNFLAYEGQEYHCAFVRDISLRKKAEAFAEGQRIVLDLIAKNAPLPDILSSLCLEIEKQSDGMLCSILLLEGVKLRHGAGPSLPDEYNRAIDGMTIGPSAGSCGTAAYTNETVLVGDIATDPFWADYKDLALRHGLKTCWSTPIHDAAGIVLGTFAVYYRTPSMPSPAHRELIATSVYFAGIAIERNLAEEALRSSEERFRLVTEATQDILWDWDLVTNEHWWSPNARAMFGYDPSTEPSIEAWTKRLHPEDRDRLLALVKDVLASDLRAFTEEYRFRLADGSYGHFYNRGQIVRDPSGKPTRMIGAMINLTIPKQAFASLQEAYGRLQAMSNELQTVESNERRRLSRELHDEVGQLLAALKFDLESVRRRGIGKKKLSPTQVTERLTRALETTDLLFSRLRQIVRALRPQVLEELGLKAALESLTADVQARTSLSCSVVIEGDDRQPGLSPTQETALYRIAQELLTNVIRHAQAKTASVSLTVGSDHWILTVEDDGIGFDPTALPQTGGIGLRGIRERVEILGGRIDLTSQRGQGTLAVVWIPVMAEPTSPTARKPRLTPSTRRRGREQAL
ncbi:MAG: PAS domain S-box protein [Nitrospiraceae bacterium]|nr:PAS domain S-box protein [Nitrospiraceae bacterium]